MSLFTIIAAITITIMTITAKVSLACRATGARPPAKIQWFRNNVAFNLPEGGTLMIMMMRSLVVMKMMAMTSLLGGEQGTMGTRSWLNIQQIMKEEEDRPPK